MSSKVTCYLRALRNEWGLTQQELSSLLVKGDRNRIRRVEKGETPPDAAEILAYRLIFGSSAAKIFPSFVEEVTEAVMQRAYLLYETVDQSPETLKKRRFLEQLRARAVSSGQPDA